VLSTHILEEVEAVCTRVVLIAAGQKRFDGTPEELAARSPWHGAVRLRIAREGSDALEGDLAKLAGVQRVEEHSVDGTRELAVFPSRGEKGHGEKGRAVLAAEVDRAVRARGLSPLELSVERGRLDDVFRELTATGSRS